MPKTPRYPYRKPLMIHAKRIAKETCQRINESVPDQVEGMPYARQWVLEEAAKILMASV